MFLKEELTRYNRQMMLPEIRAKGQEKLKLARILVIGAGGLGCPVLQYLNAAGVGTIGIVDFDKIELHNLHRQILYHTNDVGKSKAHTAAEKLRSQNPHNTIHAFNEMLNENNAETLIADYDIVVDGSDNFATRYLVNDICVKLGKTLVYGTILTFEGQLAVFNYKGGKNLRDIYPEAPDPEDVPSCDENGVLGIVPGIIGTYMALFTLQIILGTFENTNQLHLINLRHPGLISLDF
ncbi:MAG: HesA/MoeB/ThiF family protein [Bacteroidetes bacterium]|nr:HesA/MoeB/ThiF family protein [Bacteroidota bacterium]